MSYFEFPTTAQGNMLAFVLVCYIFSLIVTVIALKNSLKRGKFWASLVVTLPLTVINFYFLEQFKFSNLTINSHPSLLTTNFNAHPAYVYIAYSLFALIFNIIILLNISRDNRQNLNRMSIKDGLDNLPQALMFFSSEGDIFLRNRTMNRLSALYAGNPLKNANDFWDAINSPEMESFTVIRGNLPALRSNREVWQFSKKEVTDDIGRYYQIKATDISELYFLSLQKAEANSELADRQLRIKNIITSIEENAAAVATKNLLNNFHDNFGSMLALTKRILSDDSKSDDILDIADDWERQSDKMTAYSQNSSTSTTLTTDNILSFADRLDCTLHLKGEISQKTEEQSLINQTIYEMIKNAVYHADAKEIFAEVNDDDNGLVLVVKNLCNSHISTNAPGGGLQTIRSIAEELGGHIKVERERYFTLTVVIPKIKSQKGVLR